MAASLELRSVSEVFTLRTLGAAVSFSTKAWKVFEVGRHALQDEVDLARQHPAFAHQRLRAHEVLESREVGFGLARQMHHGEHRHLVAKLLLVEQRAVALDVAGLLQRAHAAQARRRRNADAARQFHIGHAAVVLQLFQNFAVDGIQTGGQRRLLSGSAAPARNDPYRETLFRERLLRDLGPHRPAGHAKAVSLGVAYLA